MRETHMAVGAVLLLAAMILAACDQRVGPGGRLGRRVEAACDVEVGGYLYAELDVPGASAEWLERARAVGFIAHAPNDLWADYDRAATAVVLIRAGGLGVLCGGEGGLLYDRVAFLLPPEFEE